ncbi:hypothetical protein [Gordonibacter pamelaeae]|uniref:Uncharacterized protein n=1 Tax=Gordonibacter pamelaeae 7-10-1-b TaxID=657308 RepID=D6E6Z4_9ACTN|nr:hypothetical protein [Gordonibacter pamelaeae]CBL03491.1 hypothetical protein GPA_05370 [Gordonibacter pamelaeae 7-10-1-b]
MLPNVSSRFDAATFQEWPATRYHPKPHRLRTIRARNTKSAIFSRDFTDIMLSIIPCRTEAASQMGNRQNFDSYALPPMRATQEKPRCGSPPAYTSFS